MKIRERIRALVWFRLEIDGRRRAKRCAARSRSSPCRRMPLRAAAIGWRSADLMWRLAGDTATDFNHYTKRLTLGAVYGSTLLAWLDDESEGFADTARLPRPPHRRRHAVRKMEGANGAARRSAGPASARFLGRLRYPAR